MGARAIVEYLDVIEDFGARLGAGQEESAINQFQLEGAPEAFHGGVVVAVALAAHRGHQAGLAERMTEISAGVLDAAIGMEEQMGRRRAMHQSHVQSF